MTLNEPDHIEPLRDQLRRFVDRRMPRKAAFEWDRDDYLPQDILAELAELGVFGLTVPAEFGGCGPDIYATMVTIEELSARSMAVSGPFIMSACYAGMNLVKSGSEEQKHNLLPKVAAGKLSFAYGLTEPDVGADLASVRTRAERDGECIVINGAKRFCTGARHADYIYTLVRSDANAPRYKNLSIVLVPRDSPGLIITPIDAIAQRGPGTTDVIFENVEIPVANILGGEEMWNCGWSQLAGPTLDVEKLEVAAMALGAAEGALSDAWTYAGERKQFGHPIGAHQAVRHRLAWCRTKLLSARLMLYHAASLADAGEACGVESSMAKLHVCEMAQEVALACQRVLGAYGCVYGVDMERYVRETLTFPIAGGSTEIQLNNIANRLGLPRQENGG